MRTKTKALALALCAVLLVVGTVFATMAFLTDRDSVKNTFTFGQVGISLDEAKVNTDGTLVENADRVKANEYHLIPGHNYVKDPVVHIDADSENCWIFVKLDNGLKDIIASKTIEEQMQENGWTCIDASNNIWAYDEIVGKNMNIPTFKEFTLNDNASVGNYGSAVIELIAYAVQADGFGSAVAAWEATSANFLANS